MRVKVAASLYSKCVTWKRSGGSLPAENHEYTYPDSPYGRAIRRQLIFVWARRQGPPAFRAQVSRLDSAARPAGYAKDRSGAQKGRLLPFFATCYDDRSSSHVGTEAGDERKAAIRYRRSANTSRGIATSAIWNMT